MIDIQIVQSQLKGELTGVTFEVSISSQDLKSGEVVIIKAPKASWAEVDALMKSARKILSDHEIVVYK